MVSIGNITEYLCTNELQRREVQKLQREGFSDKDILLLFFKGTKREDKKKKRVVSVGYREREKALLLRKVEDIQDSVSRACACELILVESDMEEGLESGMEP